MEDGPECCTEQVPGDCGNYVLAFEASRVRSSLTGGCVICPQKSGEAPLSSPNPSLVQTNKPFQQQHEKANKVDKFIIEVRFHPLISFNHLTFGVLSIIVLVFDVLIA